jgi:hypothetical protein
LRDNELFTERLITLVAASRIRILEVRNAFIGVPSAQVISRKDLDKLFPPVYELCRSKAEAGIAVFKNAFERWVDDKEQRPLSGHIHAALKELRAVTAGTRTSSSRLRTTNISRRR